MKIAVCVKQVPHTGGGIEIDSESGTLCTSRLRYRTNPVDIHAVEEASRLLSDIGGEGFLLTLGPRRAENTLRECLAYGDFKAYRIEADEEKLIDPAIAAEALARMLRRLSPDIVLCGVMASDDQFGQVGSRIAESLGTYSISEVVKVACVEDGRELEVQRRLFRGARGVLRAPLPAVLCLDPLINTPRYPTLPSRIQAKRAEIEVIHGLFEEVKSSVRLTIQRIGLGPPRIRPKRIFTPDSSLSASDRLAQLLSGGMTRKQSRGDSISELPPKEAASAIYDFLVQEGFVKKAIAEPKEKKIAP